jgi:hypothetical protein
MPVTIVSVLNRNDFPIEDGYDGVSYTFAPGKAITIPAVAARHIFGWDERAPYSISFEHCEQRFGWLVLELRKNARQWFKNIRARPLMLKTFEIVEMSPAERKRELARRRVARWRARKKVRAAAAEGV